MIGYNQCSTGYRSQGRVLRQGSTLLSCAPGRDAPSVARRSHGDGIADCCSAGMVGAAAGWGGALAVRIVCDLDRPSILYAIGQRAAAAKLVCGEWTQAGGQSLRALRRVKSRFVCRAVRLSRCHRADPDAEGANRGLVVRICAACRAVGRRQLVHFG